MLKRLLSKLKKTCFNLLPPRLLSLIYTTVKLSTLSKFRFSRKNVGSNSYIDPSVQIIGWRNVTIGSNTLLSEGTWINVNHRDEDTVSVIIGNNCHIGRGNFFSSGPMIKINDFGFTGLNCQFLGCSHNINSPFSPYISTGLTKGDIIEIGVNCWLATSVTILQGVKIGHGSVIGARSLVSNDIPAFSVAYGTPCKVMKRFSFKSNEWISADDWTDELESLIPTEQEYLESLNKKNIVNQPVLIAGSSRFGWM